MQSRYTTDMYEGMMAETVKINGYNNETINAYFARPLGPGTFPGVVLISNFFGFTEWYKEATRRFANEGYLAVCPNIYYRTGPGTVEEVLAKVRAAGGVPDDQVVGDASGAVNYLRSQPQNNGRVGVIGSCSGGRHTFLVACRTKGLVDAAVDLWGGRVVMSQEELTPKMPVSPIEYTKDLSCPLLGLFGEEDTNPSPAMVARMEAELRKYGKSYEFHSYPRAGHGFFYQDTPMYRQEQALDGWMKVFAFFEKHMRK